MDSEPEVQPAIADAPAVEPKPGDRCPTCDWPLDEFDHAARHRWTEYWLSLAPANRDQRQ